MKILPEDLDEAIKHPRSVQTCLVAQAGKRESNKEVLACSYYSVQFKDQTKIKLSREAYKLIRAFDSAWDQATGTYNQFVIARLRSQLPVDV